MPEHKDILGNIIKIGDTAVVPNGRRDLEVAVVKTLHPKMITVNIIDKRRLNYEKKLYPGDVLIIDDPKVTMYILKHQKS